MRRPLLPLAVLALLAPAVAAQTVLRLGFEGPGGALPPGWRPNVFPEGASAGLDSAVAYDGRKSLVVRQPTPGRYATLRLDAPAPDLGRATHVRLRGWIRTDLASGTAGIGIAVTGRPYGALAAPPAYADPAPVLLAFEVMRNRGATGTADWTRYEVTTLAPPGATEVALAVRLDGVGTAWFDAFEVEALAAPDAPPASDSAAAYVEAALDSMQAAVLDRDRVDWPAFRARVRGWARGAATPRETYPALRAALAGLNPHAVLLTPEETAALASDSSALAAAQPDPQGERLGRAGYVTVPRFTGWSPPVMDRFAQAGHDVLARLDAAGACGYVVDLRANTGGNAFPMLAAVGPLLYERHDEGPMHYDRGTVRFDGDTFRVVVGRPARARPEAPVAVLIGGETASSGEATALRFVGRPNARTFGQPSRGLTTGNDEVPLADGATLMLTTGRMKDRTGREYGGPIPPDEPVAPGPAASASPADDPVVRAALAWLERQPGCARR